MGGGRGVENIENTQNSHKYKRDPLIKKNISEKWGGGWMCHKSHQWKHIPLSRNRIPGPGALTQYPYRPSWPLIAPLYTVSLLFILSFKIVQMLILHVQQIILHLVDYIFAFLTRFFSCRVSHSSFYGRTGVVQPCYTILQRLASTLIKHIWKISQKFSQISLQDYIKKRKLKTGFDLSW